MLHASIESYASMQLTPLEARLYWWTATVYDSVATPCVPLFVMLSGALLFQPFKVGESIGVFLKKRFNRIGWAFMFWSVAYFAWRYFVNHEMLNLNTIIQGLLSGSYYHMWFLYLITGLYLVTPILRKVTTYGGQRIIRYLLLLWFLGVAVLPLLQLTTGYNFAEEHVNVFVLGGWIGYFILGFYLQNVRLRSSIMYGLLFLGYIVTIVGTWFAAFPFHSVGQYYFFFNSLNANIILTSVALFMILSTFSYDWPGSNHSSFSRVVHVISSNTLPIYLFHLMILESLQKGYFGFKLSLTTMNPIIEVPLVTFITLFITLVLILLMKKVPILKKLIG